MKLLLERTESHLRLYGPLTNDQGYMLINQGWRFSSSDHAYYRGNNTTGQNSLAVLTRMGFEIEENNEET